MSYHWIKTDHGKKLDCYMTCLPPINYLSISIGDRLSGFLLHHSIIFDKLYDTTLLMLQYHKKINSTEEWAKAWYQQQQEDRTLENFKQNQLDTLFTEQYIEYKKKELQQIQENITNYHNVNAISILNHLLIVEKFEGNCGKSIPTLKAIKENYLDIINFCN